MPQNDGKNDERLQLLDTFQGCFLGMAVGDVFGCPVEGLPPKTIQERHGSISSLLHPEEKYFPELRFWRVPGLHSDDTQQALTIADVLIEHGRLEEFKVLSIWEAMAHTDIYETYPDTGRRKKSTMCFGCHRGTGRSLRNRIKYPSRPTSSSAGDGAAMRVAPVGLFYWNNPRQRVDAAVRSAFLTHRHPLAVVSTAAVAAAIAAVMSGGKKKRGKKKVLGLVVRETRRAEQLLLEHYRDSLDPSPERFDGRFSEALEQIPQWWDIENPSVRQSICEYARQSDPVLASTHQLSDLFITMNHALLAVFTAILVAIKNLGSFKSSIIEAVNLGGDADTVAAITGAITGARAGLDGIPSDWRDSVIAREHILMRARGLLTGEKERGWEEVLDLEKRLTTMEAQARREIKERRKNQRNADQTDQNAAR